MQRYTQIRWAILPLLFLFLFFNGYGHFLLHDFMGHEDTMHISDHDNHTSHFESEHIHCDVLDLLLQPVEPYVSTFYITQNTCSLFHVTCSNFQITTSSSYLFSGRGPPL